MVSSECCKPHAAFCGFIETLIQNNMFINYIRCCMYVAERLGYDADLLSSLLCSCHNNFGHERSPSNNKNMNEAGYKLLGHQCFCCFGLKSCRKSGCDCFYLSDGGNRWDRMKSASHL